MPKITFEREVTEDQYKMIQAATILQERSFEEFAWSAIIYAVKSALVDAPDNNSLAVKCGKWFDELEGSPAQETEAQAQEGQKKKE